jgi:hypothetical protein
MLPTLSLDSFLGVVVCLFALTLFILGIFTAYFGSGKSRTAGAILLVVGLIIGIIYILYKYSFQHQTGYITGQIIYPTLFYAGATIIGIAIGFLIFLAVIMKT